MAENVLNEVKHHDIHLNLRDRSQTTLFLLFLPHGQVWFLESGLFLIVKLVEFVFVKLCHDSKAASIEKEIKLLVVFFRFSSCLANFSYFGLFLWLHFINNSFHIFVDNVLFHIWRWHLVFKSHKWHFYLLFVSCFYSAWRHFILNFFLLNFGWSWFSHFLLLNFNLFVTLGSLSFVQFIDITVFFLFVFRIFCSFYCYIRFLNLFF